MKNITPRQQKILDYIRDIKLNYLKSPTRREIADHFGFQSINSVQSHLKAIENKGLIKLNAKVSRGIELTEKSLLEIPIIGRVAAGIPIDAIENIESTIDYRSNLFNAIPDYLLRVRGESMRDFGILDNDLVAVKKTRHIQDGRIMIINIDGEVTVKKVKISKDGITLMAGNDSFPNINIQSEREFIVEGDVIGILRRT
ncbi:MAG: transcriptional repressor LexA [Proteobacteria bacterium]|nr:transcriptional repressor LexA [Pseudomonadota bacterium]